MTIVPVQHGLKRHPLARTLRATTRIQDFAMPTVLATLRKLALLAACLGASLAQSAGPYSMTITFAGPWNGDRLWGTTVDFYGFLSNPSLPCGQRENIPSGAPISYFDLLGAPGKRFPIAGGWGWIGPLQRTGCDAVAESMAYTGLLDF